MGVLGYLFSFCTVTSTSTRSKQKSMQIVEIKVKMDCDGCERKVKKSVSYMKGVESVEVNRKQSRVTVSGYVEPNKVLNRVKSTGKRAEIWPYIPQHVVSNPHAAGAYDKRAPAGHVKNLLTFPASDASDDNIVSFFNDDNVNACSIM